MAEEMKVEEQGNALEAGGKEVEGFGSPPAAPVGERREEDPVAELRRRAEVLARAQDRKLMLEYLRLRRATRSA